MTIKWLDMRIDECMSEWASAQWEYSHTKDEKCLLKGEIALAKMRAFAEVKDKMRSSRK